MTAHLDLARRSLEGLSVGDALGERFFGPPGETVQAMEARRVPPGPWRWTDDTAMALSVVEVLEARGTIDQDLLAATFARRYQREPQRGYGAGAHDILAAIARGEPWAQVGGRGLRREGLPGQRGRDAGGAGGRVLPRRPGAGGGRGAGFGAGDARAP